MELISRGAEAVIYRHGEKLIKERIRKGYRIEQLDEEIRKSRTKRECKLLLEARRAGAKVPRVFSCEPCKIVMEFISGEKIKEVFERVGEEERKKLACEIGKSVGKLHAHGICHGDLTPANMIFSGGEVYFIDFGLGFFSQRIEDFATDLSVFKEAVNATHPKHLNEIWNNFIRGYCSAFPHAQKVLAQLEKIEKRGRYVRRKEKE